MLLFNDFISFVYQIVTEEAGRFLSILRVRNSTASSRGHNYWYDYCGNAKEKRSEKVMNQDITYHLKRQGTTK